MRQKAAFFFVFLMALFFLSVEVAETSELEEKLAKIEADLKQMKSKFAQVEKGLSEMKEGLEKIQKKMVPDEEATKKQMLDNKKSSYPLLANIWLIIVVIIVLLFSFIISISSFGRKNKPPDRRL